MRSANNSATHDPDVSTIEGGLCDAGEHLLTVTAVKKSKDMLTGISLKQVNGILIIWQVSDNSIFKGKLRVGCEVVSINGVSARACHFSVGPMAKVVRDAESAVTITAKEAKITTTAAKEETYDIIVAILRGRDLVAKDTNLLTGRPTTSDPYVVIYYTGREIGRTSTAMKTLHPIWGENRMGEVFSVTVNSNQLEKCDTIVLRIFDQDILSNDDPMGRVVLSLPAKPPMTKISKWCPVRNDYSENECIDATGELLVEVEVRPSLQAPSWPEVVPDAEAATAATVYQYAGKRLVKTQCPQNASCGDALRITSADQPKLRIAPTVNRNDTPSDSSNVIRIPNVHPLQYLVTIPEGVRCGQQFPVVVQGRHLLVTRPPNSATTVRIFPPIVEGIMESRDEEAVILSERSQSLILSTMIAAAL